MKKDRFDVSELLSFEKSKVKNWLDKMKFSHIFLVWLTMVSLYGFIYFYFDSSTTHLFDTLNGIPIHNIWESLYFSFVTATTTGFGDVVPIGGFKAIAIAEVITGLLLLAIVTSKFVSIKQDQIMKELYDISINEKISRLRSSLFLYKQHLNRLSSNALEGKFKNLDLKNLGMYFTNYEDVLVETITLVNKEDSSAEHIVELDLDLLARSVANAAIQTREAGLVFTANRISWRHTNKEALEIIGDLNKELSTKFKQMDNITPQTKKLVASSLKKVSAYLEEIASLD